MKTASKKGFSSLRLAPYECDIRYLPKIFKQLRFAHQFHRSLFTLSSEIFTQTNYVNGDIIFL